MAGSTGRITPRLRGRAAVVQRERRLRRTHGLCELCLERNLVIPATVVDHTIPLAKGGSDEDDNTRNLCDPCHAKVTAQQFGHKPKVEIGLDGWPRP